MSMSAQTDVRVTVRVDRDLKENAEFLFERLGLNMSTALNMFLRKAVNEDAIPFAVSTKSTGFGHGLSADYITNAFNAAVENDVRANQQRGLPIARYDVVKKQAYLEHADGTREYVNG
jgi:DNA-damage-inducible protein J